MKTKAPVWVKTYYKKLEKQKENSIKGLFLPQTRRYQPLRAANNGAIAAIGFAQEELERLFDDIKSYEN